MFYFIFQGPSVTHKRGMNSDEVKKEREAFTDEEDTTYDLLLKQQQLYLQWQLENQNKVIT